MSLVPATLSVIHVSCRHYFLSNLSSRIVTWTVHAEYHRIRVRSRLSLSCKPIWAPHSLPEAWSPSRTCSGLYAHLAGRCRRQYDNPQDASGISKFDENLQTWNQVPVTSYSVTDVNAPRRVTVTRSPGADCNDTRHFSSPVWHSHESLNFTVAIVNSYRSLNLNIAVFIVSHYNGR